ncbi:hypothetical protein [Streptomyces sp. NPDC053367]|uniref:hypothetical protein n=1 Tax=Streptomyces sp. NPDC053367 TaxID=3365700 RepID=UPI0037D2C90E
MVILVQKFEVIPDCPSLNSKQAETFSSLVSRLTGKYADFSRDGMTIVKDAKSIMRIDQQKSITHPFEGVNISGQLHHTFACVFLAATLLRRTERRGQEEVEAAVQEALEASRRDGRRYLVRESEYQRLTQ